MFFFLYFRLLTRIVESTDSKTDLQALYNAFQFESLESGNTNDCGKKMFAAYISALFPNATKLRHKTKQTTETIYHGIKLHTTSYDTSVTFPFEKLKDHLPLDLLTIESETKTSLTSKLKENEFEINGCKIYKYITFSNDGRWKLTVTDKEVNLDAIQISDTYECSCQSIRTVCKLANLLPLCTAFPLTKSVIVSRYHTIENLKICDHQQRKVRSILCDRVVPFNSAEKMCLKCKKMTISVPNKNNDKENQPNKPNDTIEINRQVSPNTSCTTREKISKMFPGANDDMIDLLMNQADNCVKDPRGRRWSMGVISACLKWFMRSPQSYQDFRDSTFLLLPSPSLLILYKNRIKNNVGFDKEIFKWMHLEAKRRSLPVEGWSGGIILDEMSIQSDIQISKNGDIIELSGLVEIGSEGNTCHTIRTGKADKTLGTYALQLVFSGTTGFRFPFAHFISDGIQAPELYSLFWEAVDKLQMFGFKAIYTCMDGAQCNRSFLKYNVSDYTTYTCQNPCNLDSMIFMMDFSHVIKKIRNNILKSGILNSSTRLLTLPSSKTIQWQMFIDCFHWDRSNALQLHRKLTNEHLFPSTQSKMRNHLAEEVLNCEMFHVMTQYKLHLGPKGSDLDGTLELLEKTSSLIEIFRSFKPVLSIDDERIQQLHEINEWFKSWEQSAGSDSKALFSFQCHEDIHACIIGFRSLCYKVLEKKSVIHITPALINSDIVENTFNQMRSTYNGANSNPNALQYGRTLNSIILGQKTISQKGNTGKSRDGTMIYDMEVKKPSKRRTSNKSQ